MKYPKIMQKDKNANKTKHEVEQKEPVKPFVAPMTDKEAPNSQNVPIPGTVEDVNSNEAKIDATERVD